MGIEEGWFYALKLLFVSTWLYILNHYPAAKPNDDRAHQIYFLKVIIFQEIYQDMYRQQYSQNLWKENNLTTT